MQSDVKVNNLDEFLAPYTKKEIFWYTLVSGSILGMFLQGMLGLKGILILLGVYFIVSYYSKRKSKD